MPSEYNVPNIDDQIHQDQQQGQIKVCSLCHTLLDPSSLVFLTSAAAATVCAGCRDHVRPLRNTFITPDPRSCIDIDTDFTRQPILDTGNHPQNTRRLLGDHSYIEDTDMGSPSSSSQSDHHQYRSVQVPQPSYSSKLSLNIPCHTLPPTTLPHHQSHSTTTTAPQNVHSTHISRRHGHSSYSPSPLTDITRLRMRSQAHQCLYPGASFQGTQKSGRHSYDVTVTIVDVDLASSFLCGYLRIRGLTDDWPELTTYFDAEIIGSRHGFLTQNWGANEQEDMVHWSRFPAFRHVKNDLKKPLLTMSDRDRGAVFMRWKERFLVPDHRVQDINGASFAGFYYVCVDFNPPATAQAISQELPLTPEDDAAQPFPTIASPTIPSKTETPRRARRDSSVRRATRSPSATPRASTPVATMNGFYFHQNSEPYQQLSLSHVPERTTSSFEFC